jgi:hypothetical protein
MSRLVVAGGGESGQFGVWAYTPHIGQWHELATGLPADLEGVAMAADGICGSHCGARTCPWPPTMRLVWMSMMKNAKMDRRSRSWVCPKSHAKICTEIEAWPGFPTTA